MIGNMRTHFILNVVGPVNPQDAATKAHVVHIMHDIYTSEVQIPQDTHAGVAWWPLSFSQLPERQPSLSSLDNDWITVGRGF